MNFNFFIIIIKKSENNLTNESKSFLFYVVFITSVENVMIVIQ